MNSLDESSSGARSAVVTERFRPRIILLGAATDLGVRLLSLTFTMPRLGRTVFEHLLSASTESLPSVLEVIGMYLVLPDKFAQRALSTRRRYGHYCFERLRINRSFPATHPLLLING